MAAVLEQLLQPPNVYKARESAQERLTELTRGGLGKGKRSQDELDRTLRDVLARQDELEQQLENSNGLVEQLLSTSRQTIVNLDTKAGELHTTQLRTEDEIIDHRIKLSSGLREGTSTGSDKTLLEELEELDAKIAQLARAQTYLDVLAKAEKLSLRASSSITTNTAGALKAYIQLYEYHESLNRVSGKLGASAFVERIVRNTWHRQVDEISIKVLAALEELHWPKPIPPLERSVATSRLKAAFLDGLKLQRAGERYRLAKTTDMDADPKRPSIALLEPPVIPIRAMIQPLELRFRYHFDGKRQTNRLDKPEWYFAHVLNLLSEHERFLTDDVQSLMAEGGYGHFDAMTEFIVANLKMVTRRLRQSVPQLLSLPPILAHTIYQALQFDKTLHDRYGFEPRMSKSLPGKTGADVCITAEIILDNESWFGSWREAERTYADDKFFEIISASDAWQLNEDYAESGLRPTHSALRIRDLFEQITDRYRPLPAFRHRLPFLTRIQLPLLDSYHGRIASSVDAFESLTFGLISSVPGSLGEGPGGRLTAGVSGLQRLLRAGISARWMQKTCRSWGEDPLFLDLWHHLADLARSGKTDDEVGKLAAPLLALAGQPDAALFDSHASRFGALAERTDDLIVKHIVREVTSEMKPYLNKRWDYDALAPDELEISPELNTTLAAFSGLLSCLVSSLPPLACMSLYRKVAVALQDILITKITIAKVFHESGGCQFAFDFDHGWLAAAREAGIIRPLAAFRKLADCTALLSLSAKPQAKGRPAFAQVMKIVWESDEATFGRTMDGCGVKILQLKEVQAVLRKRSEAWQ
ncbi:uncharacterized protein L969DRAFT_97097 [Mixia osmundae IAM 14324]|uniref:RINT-1 family protein n=1 Tax=Mixia osmundae (strain CBS 9802 / IAM 14324 / JCM 22182 / KY 12970) TaxID=764103 RepID=G7E1N8_MIXOS|nr:uncharacterized protein L969DRAFT_97097 [Mixia osmundae IAM 14324]KEI36698.1 hypothetical protein L969DRAFT_97097 [Mixia osmundae IAM 14324]GAA96748.1 hypothetical protein E5Q_03419 [Mixia osmundae IAM 14324]